MDDAQRARAWYSTTSAEPRWVVLAAYCSDKQYEQSEATLLLTGHSAEQLSRVNRPLICVAIASCLVGSIQLSRFGCRNVRNEAEEED